MTSQAPINEAHKELVDDFKDRLYRLSTRVSANRDWSTPQAQADLRRIVALCWPHISLWSRSKFLVHQNSDCLYEPPEDVKPEVLADLELMQIFKHWPDVIAGLEGKERQFAMDVDKRRRWRNWKPTEKQIEWIKVIWATHVETEGMDPEVMEDGA